MDLAKVSDFASHPGRMEFVGAKVVFIDRAGDRNKSTDVEV